MNEYTQAIRNSQEDKTHVYYYLLQALYNKKEIPLPVIDELLTIDNSGINELFEIAIKRGNPETILEKLLTFFKGKSPKHYDIYYLVLKKYPDLLDTLLEEKMEPINLQSLNLLIEKDEDYAYAIGLFKGKSTLLNISDAIKKGRSLEVIKKIVEKYGSTGTPSFIQYLISASDINNMVEYLHANGLLKNIRAYDEPVFINMILEKGYEFNIDENTLWRSMPHVKTENIDIFLDKIKESGIKQLYGAHVLLNIGNNFTEERVYKIIDFVKQPLYDLTKPDDMKNFVHNQLSIIKILIKSYDINTRTTYGDTLLMFAVKYSKLPLIKTLLENGADRTIKDMGGKTAKKLANEQNKDKRIFETLLMKSKGFCSVDMLDDEDVYRLHLHAEGEEICARSLEEHMKAQAAGGKDNGRGEDRVVPCYVLECRKPITSDDTFGIVSEKFYNDFYVLSDINVRPVTNTFNIILKNKPTGNTGQVTVYGQNYHQSFCPICLVMEERSSGCAYMYHVCKDYLVNKELEAKYVAKRPEDEKHYSMWCVVCGRASAAHRHLTADGEFAPENPREPGVHVYAACQGGGRAEMFARLLAIKRQLASYSAEQLANKSYEHAIGIRRQCAGAADVAYLDEELMGKGRELAAMEASERKLDGGGCGAARRKAKAGKTRKGQRR